MRAAIGEIASDLINEGPALVTLTPTDLADVGEELAAYYVRCAPLFARREQRAWAELYLRGLLLADVPRKNVEALALRLLGAGPHIQCSGDLAGSIAQDERCVRGWMAVALLERQE